MEDSRITEARKLMIAVTKDERTKRLADEKEFADNMVCKCGHKHIEHTQRYSLNYTAGFCMIKNCECRNFINQALSYDVSNKKLKSNRMNKMKTAEEILIKSFKKRQSALTNLDGFVYKKAILEAMEEHKNQIEIIPLENIFKSPLSTTASREFWKRFFIENNFKIIRG